MSWDERFSNQYEAWSSDMTADVPFYVDLAVGTESPVAGLAVGHAGVAVHVARARARCVTGIDSSPSMIEQARINAADAGVEHDLRQGDMRDLDLEDEAGLIYCPF